MRGGSMVMGIVLALACLVLLGMMPVISNSRPASFDALTFAFALSLWQIVFAIPLFLWEMRGGGKGIFGARFSARQWRRAGFVALMTGAMFGLSTYLYVLGVEKAGAANAAIALQAYPLFAILLESLFLKRRKTKIELLLTALLIITLYYLGTGGSWRMSGLSPWLLITLGVPFLWSVAHIIIREELNTTPVTPAQVTFFRVVISAIFLALVIAVAAPRPVDAAFGALLASPAAIAMGFVYYLELVIWFYAVRHIDVSLASSITTPWPALTMVLAVVFLDDRIEMYQIGALIVVVACIYGLTLAGLRKQKAAGG